MENLDVIFKPKSVAIVGASRDPKAIGHQCVKNLIDSGYGGKIYPVNPKADEVAGLKCYHSISEIPGEVDIALIVVPAKYVPGVTEECGKKGVKGLVIIASGFSEVGREDLEKEVVQIAHKYGMRILGPNVVGIMNNPLKMNASFGPYLPYPGKAALISQSGALLIAMDARTWVDKVGISHMISIGNMADLDFADLIDYFNKDEDTNVISLYIEGVKDGRKFLDACKKSKKPIIALKAGVSKRGAAAAASHTGSLAGSTKIYEAAFKQGHVVQAENLNALFDETMALALQPPMQGENLLIITNGGGVGVLATDAAEKYGVPIKDAPDDLKLLMFKHMPEFGNPKNPVDLTGMADREWYEGAIRDALKHDWVDGVAVLYCETSFTDPRNIAEGIYQAIKDSAVSKPVAVSFVGGERSVKAGEWLIEHGIPYYNSPHAAVRALAALRTYGRYLEKASKKFVPYEVDRQKVEAIIGKAKACGRALLTEPEAKEVFAAYGLPVPKGKLARSAEEAVKIARAIEYPVVMKIVSPDIVHKSDAGGVKVNIKSDEEVRKAFEEIIENAQRYDPRAEIMGVYVQEMAPWGTETIIGSVNDPQFGPTVMFGLGGIFVEILKDVTFRIAPFGKDDALDMVKEIKGYGILKGARGEKPRDIEAIADAVSRLSQLVWDFREDIKEVDANPVIVYEKGLSVVDARIILRAKKTTKVTPKPLDKCG
ncbi:acetyl-CoA synthetase [Euryarchaeota archaeon ex4484_178]|nr:MAG: acetyl-CoA synthetase [Euryarchaeota archaeon ex4484_178]